MLHAVLTWFSYMFNPHEKTSSEVRKGRDIQLTILRSDIGTKTPAEGKKSKLSCFFFLLLLSLLFVTQFGFSYLRSLIVKIL